jgi:co-chaperonin GroES (HSP10)
LEKHLTPLFDRIVLEPIYETRSDVVWTPDEISRWQNGKLSISGKVKAIGGDVSGVEIGQIVYHSDSCAKPSVISGDEIRIIREDDVMFISDLPVKSLWVGAEEAYD